MAASESAGDPDGALVTRLLRVQFPSLVEEPVRPSAAMGSSNWVFRVGDRHAVRLPRTDSYAGDLVKEARWVPVLAPSLPIAVPDVVYAGEPSEEFPRPWTVVTWVPGEMPRVLDAEGQIRLAEDLGGFLRELHGIDTSGQPAGAPPWGYRCGEPVTDTIEGWLETAADGLADLFDPARVRESWGRIREVPAASMPPCWVHTDLSEENLLVGSDGRLTGVIDFGGLGIGDRSADLIYAWSLFDPPAREVLRVASGIDEATWLRARAWAFVGPGLLTILGYRDSMPARTARLVRMVAAVAEEVGTSLR